MADRVEIAASKRRIGHIGIPYLSSTCALDESWEKLEPHLDQKGEFHAIVTTPAARDCGPFPFWR